jgi:hypothetical protein
MWWGRAFVARFALAVLLLAAAPAAASAAESQPPPGFFGVVPETDLGPADFSRMEGTVGTLRIAVNWFEVETAPKTYDFARLDAEFGAAAEHGLQLLPVVYGTPSWLAADPARPPLASARARRAWGSFLRTLVARYGPGGTLWWGRRQQAPVHRWQIWNEPNFRLFWRPHPAPRLYARLLSLSAHVLREAEPGVRIVAAGVAPVGAGPPPWAFLKRLYRFPGVRRSIDVVALHPYASTVPLVAAQVRAVRTILARAGAARTPLLISELGVASWGAVPSAFVRGESGQARFLSEAFESLLAHRRSWRLVGVDWFTWRDVDRLDRHCSFCQGAGLLDDEGHPKPAWSAFRRAVEATRPGAAPVGRSR